MALKDLAAVSAPLIIRGAVDRFTQGAPAAQIWLFAVYLVAGWLLAKPVVASVYVLILF